MPRRKTRLRAPPRRRVVRRQPETPTPRRSGRRVSPSLPATRERLAFAVLALFAVICVVKVCLPMTIGEQVVTLTGSLITLIIGYYFYRPRQ